MKLVSSPRHVAIIMDGNGRWAQKRFHPRVWGHVRGTFRVSEVVQAASDFGVGTLTLYSFSTENWGRPQKEIDTLFKLLKKFLRKERNRIISNDIKFRVVGDIECLPIETKSLIENLELETKNNEGLKLCIAFGYGSKKEIADSVNKWIMSNPGKEITESSIESNLLTNENGPVDLLIRTGGDHRLSNFLLWQSAYAELFFTQTKWPDFSRAELFKILKNFSNIDRRFGKLNLPRLCSGGENQSREKALN
jgi:undecaprenyl diphosphate synthase